MDRLISLEPSNEVLIRIEPGRRCSGELTLRNVMHTMPVAFRLQPLNRSRFAVRPQSGIIPPLGAAAVDIAFLLPLDSPLPDSLPFSPDSFLLHSVVVPAAPRDLMLDAVPPEWFAAKKKQVFVDSGVRPVFVGSPVLARLVADGSMDAVRAVLERSDPAWRSADSVDASGVSLLHSAIAQGRPELVQLLLEFGADVEPPGPTTPTPTPLEAAAAAGEALIAELLLARGAQPRRGAGSGVGPVHAAAAGGHADVLRLLLAKGAAADEAAADGRTALMAAAERGRREAARLLMAAGARAEARGGPAGGTAVHAAAAAGDEAMVRILAGKGAAGVKAVRDAAGRTALEVAAEAGHSGRLLDVLGMRDGLLAAARKGERRGAERAVDGGAAVDGRDGRGWTALMRAAFKGRAEVARELADRGAEIEARDEEGYTALHCAVEAGQAKVVELLLKRGADAGARTAKGATPMQLASAFGYAWIAKALAQAGAKEDEEDDNAAATKARGGVNKEATVVAGRRKGRFGRAGSGGVRKERFERITTAYYSH